MHCLTHGVCQECGLSGIHKIELAYTVHWPCIHFIINVTASRLCKRAICKEKHLPVKVNMDAIILLTMLRIFSLAQPEVVLVYSRLFREREGKNLIIILST